jgi:hypothetical protein
MRFGIAAVLLWCHVYTFLNNPLLISYAHFALTTAVRSWKVVCTCHTEIHLLTYSMKQDLS